MQKQQAIWSQEHGSLLKKLRENARLDVSSLAHRNTVSKSQVIQLEDGGDSSFYNPDIKFSIGKKLLKFLGHDLLETTAAQPTSLEPAKTISPEPIAPSETAVSLPTAEPIMALAPIQPTPRPPAAPQNTLQSSPAKAPSPVTSKNMAWGLLLVNAFWVLAYDTVYAMVDRDDDLRIGMKTSAITLGRYDVAAVMVFYVVYLGGTLLLLRSQGLGWPQWFSIEIAAVQAFWHFGMIYKRQREACFRSFRMNHWLGATVFAGIAGGLWLKG
jgi:transcriptional regulator with XRE-family HTH domain